MLSSTDHQWPEFSHLVAGRDRARLRHERLHLAAETRGSDRVRTDHRPRLRFAASMVAGRTMDRLHLGSGRADSPPPARSDYRHQPQLTLGNSVNVEPEWTPDGTRIAYVSTVPHGNYNIFVMPLQQGNRACTEDHAGLRVDPSYGLLR